MRRFEASPRRAAPKGQTFINCTAPPSPGPTYTTQASAFVAHSRSPFSPLIRPKTPHGFISHQSRGDEPRKHESAGQRADAAPRPTAMSGPLSLRRSPLPHRDQPMLGRQPRLGVTLGGKGRQAGVSGQVRTDVGPLIPLARKLADVPETPVARLASHRTVLSVMRSACDPRAIRVRSEGTSVANPVH